MSASARLDQAQSMHPKLQITVPKSYLSALSATECNPAVLIRLPPALFIDPNTFPPKLHQGLDSVQVVSLRHLSSNHPSLSGYDFTKVEVEGGVGYSDPSGTRARTINENTTGREVKRVSGDRYVASNKRSLHSRYQNEHDDAQRPLAKEYRAALLTLQKEEFSSQSENESADASYDTLTGEALKSEAPTVSTEIPIHSRYVEPVKGKAKWTEGNYEKVQLDKPDVFWMCQGVEHSLDSSIYDQIDSSDLLPSPHSHLSLQLPSKYYFYRLKMNSQDTSLRLNIPAGDVSLAPFVHIITFASLILAAVWIVFQVQAVLYHLSKAQSVLEKKALGKAN